MKNVAEQIGPQDLLILDEADYHLFDDVCFRNAALPKCKGIIGLTATSYQVQGGVENDYLKQNKFSLIDSSIPDTTEEAALHPIKLEDFFSNSQDRPLLIFCKKGRENDYVNKAMTCLYTKTVLGNCPREYRVNERDITTLKSL